MKKAASRFETPNKKLKALALLAGALGYKESVVKIFILIILFFTSISSAKEVNLDKVECPNLSYESLVGKWYGEQKIEDEYYQRWLMSRFENGTYEVTVEYSELSNSQVTIEKHKGFWSYSQCLYTTHMLEINGEHNESSTVYVVSELDGFVFKYMSVITGRSYSLTKVDNEFKL